MMHCRCTRQIKIHCFDPTIPACHLWGLTKRHIEDHASFDDILAFAADEEAGFSELQTHAKAKRLGQFIHQLALSLVLHSKAAFCRNFNQDKCCCRGAGYDKDSSNAAIHKGVSMLEGNCKIHGSLALREAPFLPVRTSLISCIHYPGR